MQCSQCVHLRRSIFWSLRRCLNLKFSWEDFQFMKAVQDWSRKPYTGKTPAEVSESEDRVVGISVHIHSSLCAGKRMCLFGIYGIVCRWFHFTLSCVVPILSYLINIHISFKFTSFSSLLPATVNATTPTPPTVTTNMPDTNRNDKPNNGKKSCVTFFLVLCLEPIDCISRCFSSYYHNVKGHVSVLTSFTLKKTSRVASLDHVRIA